MDNTILKSIVDAFADLPAVEAILLSGSRTNNTADRFSDTDLYLYCSTVPDENYRRKIAERFAEKTEIDNRFWETEDLWILHSGGEKVECMYRDYTFVHNELQRIFDRYEACMGYSTCFAANYLTSSILFDRNGRFSDLRARYSRPYPEELVQNVIDKNYPVLGSSLSSYAHQIAVAVARVDLVSVNHRIAAYLASYFDILFAVNRQLHPGEKKIMRILSQREYETPQLLRETLNRLFALAAAADPEVCSTVDTLTNDIRAFIVEKGFRVPSA